MVDGCAGLTISGWQPDSASKQAVMASTRAWRSLVIAFPDGTHPGQRIPWFWEGVCMPISSSRFDTRLRGQIVRPGPVDISASGQMEGIFAAKGLRVNQAGLAQTRHDIHILRAVDPEYEAPINNLLGYLITTRIATGPR